MTKERKTDELETFKKWKSTGNPVYFQSLYASMKPLIYDAAKKASYGSNLPESAYRAWAAQSFHDALKTYNPSSAASLQTHVYGSVQQKSKRLNYMHQSIGYKPEPRAMQVGLYQNEYENLKESLNREPTVPEISARLGWNTKEVERIQKETKKELAVADGLSEQPMYETTEVDEFVDQLYFDLTPEEQQIFDYTQGKHGKPRLVKANNRVDFDRISKATGYSPSKARMIHGRIKAKAERYVKL